MYSVRKKLSSLSKYSFRIVKLVILFTLYSLKAFTCLTLNNIIKHNYDKIGHSCAYLNQFIEICSSFDFELLRLNHQYFQYLNQN